MTEGILGVQFCCVGNEFILYENSEYIASYEQVDCARTSKVKIMLKKVDYMQLSLRPWHGGGDSSDIAGEAARSPGASEQ